MAQPGIVPPLSRVTPHSARATTTGDRLAPTASAPNLPPSASLFASIAAVPPISIRSRALDYPTSP